MAIRLDTGAAEGGSSDRTDISGLQELGYFLRQVNSCTL